VSVEPPVAGVGAAGPVAEILSARLRANQLCARPASNDDDVAYIVWVVSLTRIDHRHESHIGELRACRRFHAPHRACRVPERADNVQRDCTAGAEDAAVQSR
jgi:hypothetical protein